jgi:hypothetical protein
MAGRLILLALAVPTLAALTLLPTAALPTTAVPAVAATADSTTTTSPTITRSAHVAYEGCPAKDVVLSVSVNRHTFVTGQPVTYRVSLHNLSGQRCNAPGEQSPPQQSQLGGGPLGFLLGPCSPLPVIIDNAKGVDVFPGPEAISCPAILGPSLAAHATISTTGTWDQMEGGLRPARIATPAPVGRYRIVVAGKVTVPITIVRVPPSPAVTGAMHRSSPTETTATNTATATNTTTTFPLTASPPPPVAPSSPGFP